MCGSSGRASASQDQSPEFKPLSYPPQKKKDENSFMSVQIGTICKKFDNVY
jgi:hypothetical protein